MPYFKKFCCCCELRTGTVVVGWLGLASCIFNVVGCSVLVSGGYVHKLDSNYVASEMGTSVVSLIACALLITGAIKGNRYLLLPWISLSVIALTVLGLFILIGSPVLFANGNVLEGLLVLLIGSVFGALDIYLLLCIWSLYQTFREQENQRLANQVNFQLSYNTAYATSQLQPPAYDELSKDAFPV